MRTAFAILLAFAIGGGAGWSAHGGQASAASQSSVIAQLTPTPCPTLSALIALMPMGAGATYPGQKGSAVDLADAQNYCGYTFVYTNPNTGVSQKYCQVKSGNTIVVDALPTPVYDVSKPSPYPTFCNQ